MKIGGILVKFLKKVQHKIDFRQKDRKITGMKALPLYFSFIETLLIGKGKISLCSS